LNKDLFKHIFYIVKLLRPRQWIKNLALFAAIVFGGQLFEADVFYNVVLGFIAFSLISSATYIINDIRDVNKDRLHPFKKARPIASGKITINEAIVVFIIILSVGFFLASTLGSAFLIIGIVFLLLQLSYSFLVKEIVIFDIFFIAAGYILRVFAGEALTGYHLSVWLLLTTISLSLFIAIGKRRSELTLLRGYTGTKLQEVRQSLSHYSEPLLAAYIVIFATLTLIFYSLFTFLENPSGIKISLDVLLPDFLPYYLQRKWLMITILPVVYAIMRYLQDIYEKNEGESPDRVLLSDKAFLASVVIWALLTIFIIYFIR